MAERLSSSNHSDHTASRPGQDRVLAAKRTDLGQSAIRLHEAQPPGIRQFCLQTVGIAPQNRRQIGIHHGCVASGDELDQRRHFVTYADLRKSGIAGDAGHRFFVFAEFPSVHEDNRDRIETFRT